MATITQEEVKQKKIDELNKKLLKDKERIWIRQFNDNFKRYKDIVKQASYERDLSMLDDMSKESTVMANRKFIYNNFPLILGIIFVLFGLIIFFLTSNDKPQVVPPQINPVFIKMPQSPASPSNLNDLPPEFYTALAQQSQQPQQQSGQPISIPINVTTGATGKGKYVKPGKSSKSNKLNKQTKLNKTQSVPKSL
jgi:hypothetical protein